MYVNIYECIVLYSASFWVIVCCDLDLQSQKQISTSTNPNTSVTKTGRNSLQLFLKYGIQNVFGSSPAATLTFDPNQCVQRTQVNRWPSFAEISWNIYKDIVLTRFFDLWSQQLISTATNPNTSVSKIGWNYLHSWDMVFTGILGRTNSLMRSTTYSRMVRCEYRMPPAQFSTVPEA